MDYFTDYSAVSQSMLKVFCDRRRLYHDYFVARTHTPPKPTEPMRKGTALHAALLEPDRFHELVVTFPDDVLGSNGAVSTDEAKAFRTRHEKAGRAVLKEKDVESVRAMAESVRRVCGDWLSMPGEREVPVRWPCEFTGLMLKARIDWLIRGKQPIVFELKTCADASPREFRRSAERFMYGVQQAQYEWAAEHVTGATPLVYFIAVEDTHPYSCAIHELDVASAADARMYRAAKLSELKQCMETNDWCEPWERRINSLSLRSLRYEE